jgi:hypothetical protein
MFYTFYRLDNMLAGITQRIQFFLQHAFGVTTLGVNYEFNYCTVKGLDLTFINIINVLFDDSCRLLDYLLGLHFRIEDLPVYAQPVGDHTH